MLNIFKKLFIILVALIYFFGILAGCIALFIYGQFFLGFIVFVFFVAPFIVEVFMGYLGEDREGKIKEEVVNQVNQVEVFFIIAISGVAWILCLSGIGVFLFQVYHYLKDGFWIPKNIMIALDLIGIDWAKNPETWFGLYKILSSVPLSVFLFVFGVLTFIFTSES
jgi:hypothetical protein